jgi:hypothetical protein
VRVSSLVYTPNIATGLLAVKRPLRVCARVRARGRVCVRGCVRGRVWVRVRARVWCGVRMGGWVCDYKLINVHKIFAKIFRH